MARRRGKYADVIPKLQPLLLEPERQQKVDIQKSLIRQQPDFRQQATWLAREWAALREEKDKLKDQLKDVNLRLEALKQFIQDQYDNEGIVLQRLANHKSVGVHYEPYVKVIDPIANQRWARELGIGHKLRLPWITLNALAKEIVLAGDPPPDGTEVKSFGKLTLRTW